MRIAATRSFRIYGLEGSNPKFKTVFIRFELRSTEVDRGRDSIWAISRRPEACRSSESHQNGDLLMLYPVEVVAGPSSTNRSRLGQYLGHFSTPRSLQKLRIAPKCKFVHALSSGMDRRAQLQRNYGFWQRKCHMLKISSRTHRFEI